MQGKDTPKSTFLQLFEPIFRNSESLKNMEADKYLKKLNTLQFIQMMACSQLEQHKSLREISSKFNDERFSQAINVKSFSSSQVSRRLRSLPLEATQLLLKNLIRETGKKIGFSKISSKLGRIHLIDSTTISLCISQYAWAEFRKTKAGVKLHVRLKFEKDDAIPDKAIITPAKPADKTQMDNLVVEEKGALNVFDRGYLDYEKFDDYCENGIEFVTRLIKNAIVKVIKELPLDQEGVIQKHQLIYLGTSTKKMKHPLRLIETEDTQGRKIVIVSNNFEFTPEELGDIYRYRWQIELFFKWIKQHMHVKKFYGLSDQAVENQLLIALMTYCLLMLLKQEARFNDSLLEIQRLLKACLYEPFSSF